MSTMPTGPQKPRPRITVEQYLRLERAATERHEYLDGRIIAMAGESLPHGIISANLVGLFFAQLKGTPCYAVTKDTKVRSGLGLLSTESSSGMFSYPDILVICGQAEFFDEHRDVITNPVAIVEVLSKSTEAFDRGDKFQRYRTWNPTLQDYLLVSQTKPHIEHFHRQPHGGWSVEDYVGLHTAVALSSVPCVLKLADVYDRIAFPEEPTETV
jgi:Uma2 family endonuclease